MPAFRKHVALLAAKTERGQARFYESSRLFRRRSLATMQGLEEIIQKRAPTTPNFPLLILTGELDMELARRMAERWHRSASNGRMVSIKGAGHCANLDNPTDFNALVLAFIDSVDRHRG